MQGKAREARLFLRFGSPIWQKTLQNLRKIKEKAGGCRGPPRRDRGGNTESHSKLIDKPANN